MNYVNKISNITAMSVGDVVDREDTCELEDGPEENNNVVLEETAPATSEVPEQRTSTDGKSRWDCSSGCCEIFSVKTCGRREFGFSNISHRAPNSSNIKMN